MAALALTFEYPVAATDRSGVAGRLHQFEHDPFTPLWEPLGGERRYSREAPAEVVGQMERMRRPQGLS
jgi:hypothetical protein